MGISSRYFVLLSALWLDLFLLYVLDHLGTILGVNVVVGLALSHEVQYEDAMLGLLAGGLTLAVAVRVIDEFRAGRGALRATLGGVVTVADPPQSPVLDEAELIRYLAEAPLYPTALLPERGIEWTPIDDQSARATLTTHHTTASLVFHVNAQDEVSHVTGERAYLTDAGTTERRTWRGTWPRYALRNGLRVPLAGEVAWVHPDGHEASYWRGYIIQIDHFP